MPSVKLAECQGAVKRKKFAPRLPVRAMSLDIWSRYDAGMELRRLRYFVAVAEEIELQPGGDCTWRSRLGAARSSISRRS
jgi:hypothetical protein